VEVGDRDLQPFGEEKKKKVHVPLPQVGTGSETKGHVDRVSEPELWNEETRQVLVLQAKWYGSEGVCFVPL
jgi:hypothetical protein